MALTDFFSHVQALAALEAPLADIVARAHAAQPSPQEIRVWVAGCATGETAYVLALMLAEALGERIATQPIQLFATDIDEDALTIARHGRYPAAALANMPTTLVERHFTCSDNEGGRELEAGKRLRDMVIFARHDLVDDPPFQHLDLIICRHALTGFDTAVQTRALQRFSFALRPRGLLLLETTENLEQIGQLFKATQQCARLLCKQDVKVAQAALSTTDMRKLQPPQAMGNHEVRSLNQASQALDEQLKAINDALEATNSELQCSNRELLALNQTLSARNEELEQLNREHAYLYDALEFPILVFDRQRRLKRFNAPAAQRFDLLATARLQCVEQLQLPAALQDMPRLLSRALEQSEPQVQLIDDEARVYQLDVNPRCDDSGHVQLVVVMLLDITEMTRVQADLRDSQSQLNALMENTTILLAMKDLAGSYLFANPSFLDAFGLDVATYRGRNDFELFAEPFAAELWKHDLEALRHRRVVTAEHVQQRPDDRRIFRTTHQLLHDASGRPCAIITESEDITQRKRAEQQSRIAARIFEQAGEAIVVTDDEGRIQTINAAFTRITGYAAPEAQGKVIRDLLTSGQNPPAFYDAMWQQLDDQGYWQGEVWNRRKNGEIYPQWLTINRIDNENEEPPYYISVFADITQLKKSQQEAEFLATHDALTKLPNRVLFQDRLRHALAQARRGHHVMAVMFIDLDNFKTINDTLGHDIGDELLIQAGKRISQSTRDMDTVARLGGDEFTVILTETTIKGAEQVAERIAARLARPFDIHCRTLFISSSIGLAFYPDDGQDATTLTKAADSAMYRAKENGRNRVELFKPELHARLIKQATLESALRDALKRDRLRLVFQPKYAIDPPTRIVGAEALLRWHDPDMGEISPAVFIPIAETTGLILEIDRHVACMLVEQIARWQQTGLEVPPIAFNVSAKSFQEGRFVDHLFAQLDRLQVAADRIQVEITERTLLERTGTALDNIEKLKQAGIHLAIDDFGTGYSSLSYLKQLPLAELKVDKSFIDGLGSADESDAVIARAILGMASALGLNTVAEGVETPEQLAWLSEQGCNIAQGYLFSPPLGIDMFEALFKHKESVPCLHP